MTDTPRLTIDHAAYLSDRAHRRLVHAGLRRAARRRGQVSRMSVLHEHDGSCCVRQPWPATAMKIQDALSADGQRAAWLFAGADAAVLVSPREVAS